MDSEHKKNSDNIGCLSSLAAISVLAILFCISYMTRNYHYAGLKNIIGSFYCIYFSFILYCAHFFAHKAVLFRFIENAIRAFTAIFFLNKDTDTSLCLGISVSALIMGIYLAVKGIFEIYA